jgi:putative chitinase
MSSLLTISLIRRAATHPLSLAAAENARALAVGMETFAAGIDQPHRLAQFLGQLMHESGDFRFDREIWGPTAAQRRYDTRTDLGNTPEADLDGFLYRGRTSGQLTGRFNYRDYRNWCMEEGLDPPDFEAEPDLTLTDPWEGLAPVWYWTSRGLNRLADAGDIENITQRINGGLNGYEDRIRRYTRCALAILGRDAGDVRGFQAATPGLKVDGIAGPNTRGAMHQALVAMGAGSGSLGLVERLDRLEADVAAIMARLK